MLGGSTPTGKQELLATGPELGRRSPAFPLSFLSSFIIVTVSVGSGRKEKYCMFPGLPYPSCFKGSVTRRYKPGTASHWLCDAPFLCLHFLSCRMGTGIVPLLQGCCEGAAHLCTHIEVPIRCVAFNMLSVDTNNCAYRTVLGAYGSSYKYLWLEKK